VCTAVPKVSTSRLRMPLVLMLMLKLQAGARPADAPLRKLVAPPSQRREVTFRREICAAIQNDLAQKGVSTRWELRPEDLRIQASLPPLMDDMGLQVKRVGYDPIRQVTVFELWASHEPRYLPFEVTTRRGPEFSGAIPPSAGAGSPRAGRKPAPVSKPAVLAKPGTPATLVMLGENVRITITVVPLQPGIKGQRIFVRDASTARVLAAEVVDQGLLRASF
jgi:hypothetical protein